MNQAAQVLQNSSSQVILFAAIFLVVFMLAMLLCFMFLKRRGPRGAQMNFQVTTSAPGQQTSAADFGKPDNWQPPAGGNVTEDRRGQLLRNLDTINRGMSKFYIVFVCFIMAAITGVAVFLYVKVPPKDPNRDFLILYGGGLYVAGMLWGCAQLVRAMRRLSSPPGPLSGFPLGVATPKINLAFRTTSRMEFIGKEALDRAQQHLDSGGSLEEACALADPKYSSMSGMMQKIFQTAIQASIDERRKMQP